MGTALGVVAALGAVALAAPVAAAFGDPSLASAVRSFAPLVPFLNALNIAGAALRGAFRARTYIFLVNLLHPLLQLVSVALVLAWVRDLSAVIGAVLVSTAVATILACSLALREFPPPVQPFPFRRIIGFGGWNTGVRGAHFALLWGDLLVIMFLLSAVETGIYRAAAQAVIVLTLVSTGVNFLYMPTCSAMLAAQQHLLLSRLTRQLTRLSFVPIATLGILFVVDSRLLLWTFGPNTEDMALPFQVLAAAQVLTSILGPSSSVLLVGGRAHLEVLATFLGVAASVGLAFLWIPGWGLYGAALATAAGFFLRAGAQLIFLWRHFHLLPASRETSVGILLFLVSGGVGFYLSGLGGVSKPVLAASLAAAFLATAIFAAWTAADRRIVRHLAGSLLGIRAS